MRQRTPSRRDVLTASTALAAGELFAQPAKAAAPEPTAITPALIAAARKEGKVASTPRSSCLVGTARPGIRGEVFRRRGAGRAVGRRAHLPAHRPGTDERHPRGRRRLQHRRQPFHRLEAQRLARAGPAGGRGATLSAEQVDGDGMYATVCASLSAIGYNTNLVKPEEAPKSFADLLDPKWKGKIVKAHPAYSGTILTATFALARELGWPFFAKLAAQKVMQVQSAGDPPKKLALGERAVQADGADFVLWHLKAQGQPVDVVYAGEGTPLIVTPACMFPRRPIPTPRACCSTSCSAPKARRFSSTTAGTRSTPWSSRSPAARRFPPSS